VSNCPSACGPHPEALSRLCLTGCGQPADSSVAATREESDLFREIQAGKSLGPEKVDRIEMQARVCFECGLS